MQGDGATRYLAAEAATKGDVASWVAFVLMLAALLAFDVMCLQAPGRVARMSVPTAAKLTFFWFSMGLVFDLFVLGHLGWEASLGYLGGFFMEYMLSFDNLFVFHMVFSYYCTPEALLYRALTFGIQGAIVLRVFFLFVGYAFISSGLYIVKLVLGAFLIYSGIKTAGDWDDEEDASDNRFIAWLSQHLPVSDHYEPDGHFFFTEETEHWTGDTELSARRDVSTRSASMEGLLSDAPSLRQESTEAFAGLPRLESFEGSSLLDPHRLVHSRRQEESQQASDSTPSGEAGKASSSVEPEVPRVEGSEMRKPRRQKASLLLLVVIAVWVVDIVFAVDSVASKLASVSDVFLNCASSAFAMMSLRSLYFVMEALTQTFQMLKYGVAAVLVLIGLKLVFSYWVDLSNSAFFAIILVVLVSSMIGSYWAPQLRENCECPELGVNGTIFEGEEEEEGPDVFERRGFAEFAPSDQHDVSQQGDWHGRDSASSVGTGFDATGLDMGMASPSRALRVDVDRSAGHPPH